nr:hypothetical protein [Parapedobacter sp. ISTM3]
MKTSRTRISGDIEEGLTSCPADSPANHSPLPESGSVQRMTATCGPSCLEQFDRSGPVGSWAKTFAGLLVGMEGWSSRRCALSWKLRVTKYCRSYFLLQASTPRTGAKGSGSSRMRVRPDSGQSTVGGLLPTPTTGSNRNSRNAVQKIGNAHQRHGVAIGLAQLAEIADGILPKEFDNWTQVPVYYKTLLPTPHAGLHKTSGMKEASWHKRIAAGRQEDLNMRLFRITGKTGRLNPHFVLEMMGFPMEWLTSPFRSGTGKVSMPVGMR